MDARSRLTAMNHTHQHGPDDLARETRVSLSWSRIKSYYAQRAQSEQARARIHAMDLQTPTMLRPHYDQLNAWIEFLASSRPLSLPDLMDPQTLAVNPFLDPFDAEDLIRIRRILQFWLSLSQYESSFVSNLVPKVEPEIERLASTLTGIFSADGNWAQDVSPSYKRLLGERRQLETALERQLGDLIRKHHAHLSEPLVFERNGRKVLAVSSSARGRVRGIVQDSSASGQSLFVEPEPIIGIQNRLVEVESEIREELFRIRRELSKQIVDCAALTDIVLPRLTHFDVMQTLAQVAHETESRVVVPQINGPLRLIRARHPYLDASFAELRRISAAAEVADDHSMVPVDACLGADLQGLMITGANTGGKTVTLKTIGLIALLANSGFPVPLESGSQVPAYQAILADIGDHQSMDQSLSTFASHLRNLRLMTETEWPHALILLDEIGSGTDPQEADALSQAVIEFILQRGFHVIVTTHHQLLCTFALNHPHLDNGSVSFDSQRLEPTYRFVQGVPGRSHALEIARRAGLNTSIMGRANALRGSASMDIQTAINELGRRTRDTEKLKSKLRRKELKVHRQVKQLRAREEQVEQRIRQIEETADQKIRHRVDRAELRIRSLLAQVESKRLRRESVRQFSDLRDDLQVDNNPPVQKIDLAKSDIPVSRWSKGDAVFVTSFGREGTLESIDRNRARVNMGGMTLQVDTENIVHLLTRSDPDSRRVKTEHDLEDTHAVLELKLLGYRVDDALIEVDSAIDAALSRGTPFLTLIHGHGTGSLKKAIRAHLERHPARKAFQLTISPENDGQTELRFDA